jgi:hypothetical protein
VSKNEAGGTALLQIVALSKLAIGGHCTELLYIHRCVML